jgi:Tol biopolymer transport system component
LARCFQRRALLPDSHTAIAPGVYTNGRLLSATPDGLPGNSISASPSLSAAGRWIAFQSLADNLVSGDTNGYMDVFVYDQETGAIELASWASDQ